MAPYKVLLVEPIDQRAVTLLASVADVRLASAYDEATLIREGHDVHGMVFRALGRATRHLMESCPHLRVVARHGVGVDNIDVEAATELGIQVVNTPLANAESVAEQTIGMLLALAKQIVRADHAFRRGFWEGRSQFIGTEAKGKTLGIVGAGRIGTRVAEIARRAFEMDIVYSDVRPNPKIESELGGRRTDLDTLLSVSDFVSLHVPFLPETDHLIGRREISLMKSTTYLLNLSRGRVVDEAALIEALQSGRIAGAGLDVFEIEPVPPDHPLLKMDNVVVTPHMASLTKEAMFAMAMVVKDVIRVLQGEPPEFPVNHPTKVRR